MHLQDDGLYVMTEAAQQEHSATNASASIAHVAQIRQAQRDLAAERTRIILQMSDPVKAMVAAYVCRVCTVADVK